MQLVRPGIFPTFHGGHMRTICVAWLLAAGCFTPLAGLAAPISPPPPVLFDFEDYADGDEPELAGLARFHAAVVLEAGISLNEFEVPPKSGSRVLANLSDLLTIQFPSGLDRLSGHMTYGQPVTISFYGLSGLLGTISSGYDSNLLLTGDLGSAPNELFAFDPAAAIRAVTFAAAGPMSFVLDDLLAQPLPPVVAVPEPGTPGLALAGLAMMAWFRRRRAAGVGLALLTGAAQAQTLMPELTVYPANIALATATRITVTYAMTDPAYIPGSLVLNQVDASNKVIRRLTAFADDGQNGDAQAGDGIHTARFMAQEAVAGNIFVSASAAFQRRIARVSSPAAVLTAAADVEPASGLITRSRRTVSFRDANGMVTKALKLANLAVSPATLPDGPAELTVMEVAFVSESQTRIGILSSRAIRLETLHEGAPTASLLRYFDQAGQLLFARESAPGKVFFTSAVANLASRNGARLLAVELNDDQTTPRVLLLSENGALLHEYAGFAGITGLSGAQLSADGRYIGLVGTTIAPQGDRTTLVVIDTLTHARTERSYAYAPAQPVDLVENDEGRLMVVIGDTVSEVLP
jgi:hypothetical protein